MHLSHVAAMFSEGNLSCAGASTMTITNVIEMVIVAVLIYVAVLKFMKR